MLHEQHKASTYSTHRCHGLELRASSLAIGHQLGKAPFKLHQLRAIVPARRRHHTHRGGGVESTEKKVKIKIREKSYPISECILLCSSQSTGRRHPVYYCCPAFYVEVGRHLVHCTAVDSIEPCPGHEVGGVVGSREVLPDGVQAVADADGDRRTTSRGPHLCKDAATTKKIKRRLRTSYRTAWFQVPPPPAIGCQP